MNLTTLEMTVEQAETSLREYTQLPADKRSAEDEAIAMGLRAAARGLPIIVLSEVIRAGGFFEGGGSYSRRGGQPRLAVARADAKSCRVSYDGQDVIYDTGDSRWGSDNRGALVGSRTVRVRDTIPLDEDGRTIWFSQARTIVPIIPPRHRPKNKRLGLFHILWEVEKWDPTPPVDPALLRHIRGDLWAVVAKWDLTPLERAVLAQRA